MKKQNRGQTVGARKVTMLFGKLRQKSTNGPYYYRLTISNGRRKEFALKTSNYETACQKAADLDAIWVAPTQEVAIAQINAIKGFSKSSMNLPLTAVPEKYAVHPLRATPHTTAEQQAYPTAWNEFVRFVSQPLKNRKIKHTIITRVNEITPEVCEEYSNYLKSISIAVDTHNRKMRRLRRIMDCMKEYYAGDNPFKAPSLRRNSREEQGTVARRMAFTREQEENLKEVLADKVHKLINKEEIRIVYLIGMYTGQRLKDCCLLQWQNIDMIQKRIWVKQFKTGKEVTIPIAQELYLALNDALKWKENQYVTPKTAARYESYNSSGKNIGNNLVDLDVLRVIKWIGLETSVSVTGRKKKMTVYGFHSLRHSFVSFCAEAGVPKATLLSIIGTGSDIADKYYTHVSAESQLKAIEAVSNKPDKNAQEKINEIYELLNTDGKSANETLDQIRKILE